MMLKHLFYQNPVTFGNYILILKTSSVRTILSRFSKKKSSIKSRLTTSFCRNCELSRAIAIKRTINRPENRDKIVGFAAISMTWVNNTDTDTGILKNVLQGCLLNTLYGPLPNSVYTSFLTVLFKDSILSLWNIKSNCFCDIRFSIKRILKDTTN
jgi:hypothetical protein